MNLRMTVLFRAAWSSLDAAQQQNNNKKQKTETVLDEQAHRLTTAELQ